MNKMEIVKALLCDHAETTPKKCTEDGGIRIVILQRGWVMVGEYYQSGKNCWLERASVIRAWGTTKGLGEIASSGPTDKTILDKCPIVRFHELTVVAMIDCESGKWRSRL